MLTSGIASVQGTLSFFGVVVFQYPLSRENGLMIRQLGLKPRRKASCIRRWGNYVIRRQSLLQEWFCSLLVPLEQIKTIQNTYMSVSKK